MRRVILNFHGLGAPARTLEPGEAAYWVDPALFEESLELARSLRDRVETHITFDDGNASDLEIAAPILGRYGIAAEIFVLADRIGQPGSLDAAGLRQLVTEGHRIGSHGAGHVDWRNLDATGRRREFIEARAEIAAAAGQQVTLAAIPFGRYNRSVLDGLAQAGFARIYSSDGGAWRTNRAPIPRTSPTATMTVTEIETILLGHESPTRRLRRSLARALKTRL